MLLNHVVRGDGDSLHAATAFALRLFFRARVVQAVVHMLGVPWLRTLAFLAGWVGSLIILWRILY